MSDNEEEPAGEAGPRTGGPPDPMNAMSVMEDINDKLKILNYEHEFCKPKNLKPLTCIYFCHPGKASEQFPYFSQLVAWILNELKVDFLEWNEFDDPNSISNTMMEALKKLGFNANFPVSKLRHGSGDAVCMALDFLLDKTLAKKRFAVQAPVYKGGDFAEEAAVDDGAEVEDDNGIDEDMEEEQHEGEDEIYFGGGKAEEKTEEEKQTLETLEAKVDPKEWKLELERVSHRLKFRANPDSKEWRTHLEQSAKHEKALLENFPEQKTQLEKIGKQLSKAVQKISAKERTINKEFDHLGDEFRQKQSELDSIQERYNALGKTVAEQTAELASITEAVEACKTNTSDRNNSMTDVTPMRRIQTALAALKSEVDLFELRIGVVGQTLMQSKMRVFSHSHQNSKHQADLQYGGIAGSGISTGGD